MTPSIHTFVGLDREVIVLAATTELIDTMVNLGLFALLGEGEHRQPMPHSRVDKAFFSISLVDFLSGTDEACGVGRQPYLAHLAAVCDAPSLGDATSLHLVVEDLRDWLRCRIKIEGVWLPSLDIETTLAPTRVDWLRTCGDLSKHNVLRSGGTAKMIQSWLDEQGHAVGLHDILLALPEIQDWLDDNVLSHQIIVLTQRLNALRWAIHDYLYPYFLQAYKPSEDGAYMFALPIGLTERYPKARCRELLNWMRKGPIMPRFTVDPVFLEHYA